MGEVTDTGVEVVVVGSESGGSLGGGGGEIIHLPEGPVSRR